LRWWNKHIQTFWIWIIFFEVLKNGNGDTLSFQPTLSNADMCDFVRMSLRKQEGVFFLTPLLLYDFSDTVRGRFRKSWMIFSNPVNDLFYMVGWFCQYGWITFPLMDDLYCASNFFEYNVVLKKLKILQKVTWLTSG